MALALAMAPQAAAAEDSAAAIRRAVALRDRDGFAAAISSGADWRDAGLADDSVLSFAAAFDAAAALRVLVARRFAVDAKDRSGETALFAAAAGGAASATQVLLALGADPDRAVTSRRAPSWTPLFAAAAEGHLEIVRLLLAAPRRPSADDTRPAAARVSERIDATDRHGRTALFYAVLHGQTPVVRALLEAGAAADRKDADGHTAGDVAKALGRAAEAELLLARAVTATGPQ